MVQNLKLVIIVLITFPCYKGTQIMFAQLMFWIFYPYIQTHKIRSYLLQYENYPAVVLFIQYVFVLHAYISFL